MELRVLLAEDHSVVGDGLRALLAGEGFTVVGLAHDGQEAVRLTESLRPDVAVLDIAMPRLNGIDAAREINRSMPEVKTILLTMYNEESYVLDAVRAGVAGFVLKKQAAVDLIQAIREVSRGGVYLSPGVSRTVVEAIQCGAEFPAELLTARERQVLQLVAEGKASKEIADLLNISVRTAEAHRGNIMRKLDIHETAGLVRYAIRRGLVQV